MSNCLMANIQQLNCNTNVIDNLVAMCRTNFIPVILKNAKYAPWNFLKIMLIRIFPSPAAAHPLSQNQVSHTQHLLGSPKQRIQSSIFLLYFYSHLDSHEKFFSYYWDLCRVLLVRYKFPRSMWRSISLGSNKEETQDFWIRFGPWKFLCPLHKTVVQS